MGSHTAPKEVTSIISSWISDQEKAGATGEQLAKKLRVSRTQVINVRDGSRGAGPVMEQAFADLMYGGSVDALRRAARGESVTIEPGAGNPELAKAVEFRRGQLPDAFLDEYLETEAKSEDRLGRDAYLGDIGAKYARWVGKEAERKGDDSDIGAKPPGARRGRRKA